MNRLSRTGRLTLRQQLAAGGLAMVAVAFLVLDATGGSVAGAHSGVSGVFGSLYRGTDSVLGPVRRYVQALPSAGHDSTRIASLEQQNAALRGQIANNTADTATAAQLAQLGLAAGTEGDQVQAGRVIAFGPGQGFDWTATLSVGSSNGVAVGQTVTSAAGLVGRVLTVNNSTSVVLLAVDPGSGVGVRDTRNNELALATGAGTAGFTVTPIDPGADLRVGDVLQSGPAGASTYAAGLPVGTITAVHVAGDGTVSATVAPASTPTTIDLVGVIIGPLPTSTSAAK
jgi:rod shape-determining protein MreC